MHGCQPRHRDQREATDTKLYDSTIGQGEHTLSASGTLASGVLCILVVPLGCTTQVVILNTHRLCACTTRRRLPLHSLTSRLLPSSCCLQYGIRTEKLGTWERGQQPGNEASGLGMRPAGALYSYCTVCHMLSFLPLGCTDTIADGSSVEQNQGMGIGLESQEPT